MKRILLPASMLVALAVAAPAQAAPTPGQGLATAGTTPAAAVVPTAVPAIPILPEAAAVTNPGFGVMTAPDAGAPVGP
jgi:hypothetical protein